MLLLGLAIFDHKPTDFEHHSFKVRQNAQETCAVVSLLSARRVELVERNDRSPQT